MARTAILDGWPGFLQTLSSNLSRCHGLNHRTTIATWCRRLYSRKTFQYTSSSPTQMGTKKNTDEVHSSYTAINMVNPTRSSSWTTVSPAPSPRDQMETSHSQNRQSRTFLHRKTDGSADIYMEQENEYFHQVLENTNGYKNRLIYESEEYDHTESDVAVSMEQIKRDILVGYDTQSPDVNHLMSILTRISELPVNTRFSLKTDEEFRTLCYKLLSKMETLTDEEFFGMLRVLSKFGFRRAVATNQRPFRFAVFNFVNAESTRRAEINKWGLDQLFLAADFCFASRTNLFNTGNSTSLLVTLFKELQTRLETLSREELVLMMYHCTLSRQIPTGSAFPLFEKCLEHFDKLGFGELAIVCLGCFKTNTPIYNLPLVVKITRQLVDKMRYADPLALSAIFKTLYKSTTKSTTKYAPELQGLIGALLEKSTLVLSDLPFSTAIHLFRFFLNIHYISQAFLEEIASAVLKEDLEQWRVKEIARFLFHLGNFQCYCESASLEVIVSRFLTELDSPRRRQELQAFPESLAQSLLGLAFLNIYHDGLTHSLFSEKFQKQLTASTSRQRGLKGVDFSRDLFQLDQSLTIDRPQYKGNRLSREVTSIKGRTRHGLISTLPQFDKQTKTVRDSIMMEVRSELEQLLGGPEWFKIHHLLPHYQTADIEMRLDSGRPVCVEDWAISPSVIRETRDIPEEQQQPQTRLNQLLLSSQVTSDSANRLAVLLFGPNCYHIYRDKSGENSKHLLGLHVMKMRHLSKVGFTVIQIPYFEFNRAQNKQKYLKRKVFERRDDPL